MGHEILSHNGQCGDYALFFTYQKYDNIKNIVYCIHIPIMVSTRSVTKRDSDPQIEPGLPGSDKSRKRNNLAAQFLNI